MEEFFEQLILRAATIDELLSSGFESIPGQKGDTEKAARRLAAWCRACASGDWALFAKRLGRDGLSIGDVLTRFATVRRRSAALPAWIDDAIWIEAAMRSCCKESPLGPKRLQSCAFEHLFAPVVDQAEARLWEAVGPNLPVNLTESARHRLRLDLLTALTNLCAPALYVRFVNLRKKTASGAGIAGDQPNGTVIYDQFIDELRGGGLRQLFGDRPVLLRLISVTTRQWLDTTQELLMRLGADLNDIRRDILPSVDGPICAIEGDLSDPHNNGRSVRVITFADGGRVVYKPKDLRLDSAWHALIRRLNAAAPPIDLKAARVLVRDGYGWAEFIDHVECANPEGAKQFYFRSGGWLALFHLFASTDMHQENMIAAADHPVPIDLETILQPSADENKSHEPEAEAFEAAMEIVTNSVIMVGLLPAYAKAPDNGIFAIGGLIAGSISTLSLAWDDINSDKMRPVRSNEDTERLTNLPSVSGCTAGLGDHIDDLVAGFKSYSEFLLRVIGHEGPDWIFKEFARLPTRKILRPTRFYYMLLERLKNYTTMEDGVIWSAQADFVARFSNWDSVSELLWPLQRAERLALLQLNLPYFVSTGDGNEISDHTGVSVNSGATGGLIRAGARVRSFFDTELDWQIAVIRQSATFVTKSNDTTTAKERQLNHNIASTAPTRVTFVAEAANIANELALHAIRRGPSAAWIGLDWLGDSEIAQLLTLGSDLYGGNPGIAIFLAAYAKVSGSSSSKELALAAMAHLRKNLRSHNAARIARSLGIGGGSGLGSIIYALAVMAKCLSDSELLADAHLAGALFTDDLIGADKSLDVLDGSAGAILALLRLYRDTQSTETLNRAIKCGEHLLTQPRVGADGYRSWIAQGIGDRPLNGISHGAAGFSYALASLSVATGRRDFADASAECIAFENSTYDVGRSNWPDLRHNREPFVSCQWCHGAPGIGLARIATSKLRHLDSTLGALDTTILATDIRNALVGAESGWPNHVDTMCCGTLGNIEFFCEAADTLGYRDLRGIAARRMLAIIESARLTSDYRFNLGSRKFNLGLFCGLAGVGYACLRQADPSLPNILIWE